MDKAPLPDRLHVDEVSQDELRMVLESHFQKARHEGGDSIDYLKADEVALSLVHGRAGLVPKPGPALTEEDVAAVQEQLERAVLADRGTKIRREVLFSAVPVNGSWRYRDAFQIVPLPSDAPRPPQILGDHPFVLEVPYADSIDASIAIERGRTALDEMNLVLAGLLPRIDARPRSRVNQQWAIVMSDEEGPPTRSVWTQTMYLFEGFESIAKGFTSEPGPPLQMVEDSVYYGRRGISGSEELDLPASIETMLDRFVALDPARQDRFLRWCYWLNHSRLTWELSMSASYMAVIQAVEALRPEIAAGPECPTCDRATGPSPTRQFADFMQRYVPPQDGETEKERSKLYALRSGLTHGGKLLAADLSFTLFGGFHPGPIAEQNSFDRAALLGRLAGVNWLLANGD